MAEIESVNKGQADPMAKWLSEHSKPSPSTRFVLYPSRYRHPAVPNWIAIADYSAEVVGGWVNLLPASVDTQKGVGTDEAPDWAQEIEELRGRVLTLETFVFSSMLAMGKSPKTSSQMAPINKPVSARIDELCHAFVDLVKVVKIAQQVHLSVTENMATIFTVIDAPPFRDTLRQPIYEAQLQTLRMSEKDVRLDFDLVNLQELSEKVDLAGIIPGNAKMMWSR